MTLRLRQSARKKQFKYSKHQSQLLVAPALPTAFWDFPIEATNYAWSVLGGSWLGLMPETFATTGDYDCQGNWNPYSPAPTTAHIMWTKPTQFSCQIGGAIPGDEMHNFMTTTIMSDYFEPIIIQGVLYYGQFQRSQNITNPVERN